MRGVYTAHVAIAASTLAAKTLLYGTNGSSSIIEILSAQVTDANQTTVEQLNIGISRVTTAGSPAGGAVDINKSEASSATTGVTWLSNLTSEPTTYAADYIDHQGSTNMGGYFYDPLPETRKYIAPGGAFGLRLLTALANSTSLIVQITYREIG